MTTSAAKPSDALHVFDLPRPRIFNDLSINLPAGTEVSKFVYNFYVANESVDDSGEVARSITDPELSSKPRYIKLNFMMDSAQNIRREALLKNLNLPESFFDENVTRAANGRVIKAEKFNSELTVQNVPTFVKLGMQDLNVNKSLFNLVKTSAEKRIIQENERIQDLIDARKDNFLNKTFKSQTDLARVMRRQVDVQDDVILDAITDIDQLNELYIDEQEQRQIIQDNFAAVKRVKFTPRISSKFVGSMVQSAVNDVIGTYTEEFLSIKNLARQVQNNTVTNYKPTHPDQDPSTDLKVEFLPNCPIQDVGFKEVFRLGSLRFLLSGYRITKKEILSDGSIREFPTFCISAVDNRNQEIQFIDFEVAYNRRYSYEVEAIYVCLIPVLKDQPRREDQLPDRNSPYNILKDSLNKAFLILSPKSVATFIHAVENVPPRPPESLSISYVKDTESNLVIWRMPQNPQRDIKRFQVLRRTSIDEAFELQTEIDFDQSAVLYDTVESVTRDLRVREPVVRYHFLDKDIDKSKAYIYTLRSVDAHGMISNYSEQLQVKYNGFTDKLDVTMISTRGAPAQFPNFNLISRKFAPTIKDSNHRRLKVYFDPEYLKLTTKNEEDEVVDLEPPLFNFESDEGRQRRARFQLQILNTDLQQSETIDIFIPNSRARNL
jgi:hypothetical protein